MDNSVNLSGKHAFDILLDIIIDLDLMFIKQDYLNKSDYNYFFTTEKINDNSEMINILRKKKSLELAYLTLFSIKNLRLSIFIAIKNKIAYYGFHDELNNNIYKVGKFKSNDSVLTNIASNKTFRNIRPILKESKLNNLEILQTIKFDFHTIFDGVKSNVKILDEYRIRNSFDINIFKKEDQDELSLNKHLENWSKNFKWFNKCFYITVLTDDKVNFYIKLRPTDYQDFIQKVQDHDI